MDRDGSARVPDRVPEEWVRRYGTQQRAQSEGSPGRARAEAAPLGRLVTFLVTVAGAGAAVAWLFAGVPGIVAVVVPAATVGGGGVLLLRWLIRTAPDSE